MKFAAQIFFTFIVILGVSGPTKAFDFEKLIMPGPLAEAHADLEADCGECHSPFKREREPGLCLVCHEDVDTDRALEKGFHGKHPGAASECRSCHIEHRGRDADLVELNEVSFNHRFTDFALKGLHQKVECAACHDPEEKHREAPSNCFACHEKDDAHEGKLGEDCSSCHAETGWKKSGDFDHDETEFPLVGEHQQVDCNLCHPSNRFESTPEACVSCHAANDPHRGSFGTDCGSCHTPEGWKDDNFDHDRDTRFPLRGSHADADCRSCHVEGIQADPPARDCVSCHRPDDEHKGRNGPDCGSCHVETAWRKVRFNHDRDTEFDLTGAHREVECSLCHVSPVHKKLPPKDCVGCHSDTDPHKGSQGDDCGTCHNTHAWTSDVAFDHDLTMFPLLGLHAIADCEQCHTSAEFDKADPSCIACHADDDYHKETLGTDCGSCHNPNGWRVWRFDHDVQTTFQLHGAHSDLACASCHTRPARNGDARVSKVCIACHAHNDVHRGAFGKMCDACHSETTWSDVELPR